MASREGNASEQKCVEQIDYHEITIIRFVGKGSFGNVYKGKWRDEFVAVKHIQTESERKAFMVEVNYLSRVSHKNIIKLYGACTDDQQNPVCLVMEYAEGGSLYNVLQGKPQKRYSAGHAISWTLQCACGVAYLHNMKPKPLIHRDLKSPNLLLVRSGRILKICDFGTVCDKNTNMTNNQGSAGWMAPEVFEGSHYTEKCDVYSWGIILWEVLSRRKPFCHLQGGALRILWETHKGKRPPRIQGCPKPIEEIMTRCWDQLPDRRPSMDYVVEYMSKIIGFFGDFDWPIEDLTEQDVIVEVDESEGQNNDGEETETGAPETEIGTEISSSVNGLNSGMVSRSDLLLPSCIAGGSACSPLTIEVDPMAEGPELTFATPWPHNGERREQERPTSFGSGGGDRSSQQDLDNVYLMLDKQLHPVPPDTSCQESMQIFQEHKQLAQEYLRVQTEMAYLSRHKEDLVEKLSEAEGLSQLDQQDTEQQQELLRKLSNEKADLLKLRRNLECQLDIIRRRQTLGGSDDSWELLPLQIPQQNQHPSHPA